MNSATFGERVMKRLSMGGCRPRNRRRHSDGVRLNGIRRADQFVAQHSGCRRGLHAAWDSG